ncbi:hypothetical protein HAX54_033939, partial [Datura stramonium]|nr:hypothetical protein [Datura stramonium]
CRKPTPSITSRPDHRHTFSSLLHSRRTTHHNSGEAVAHYHLSPEPAGIQHLDPASPPLYLPPPSETSSGCQSSTSPPPLLSLAGELSLHERRKHLTTETLPNRPPTTTIISSNNRPPPEKPRGHRSTISGKPDPPFPRPLESRLADSYESVQIMARQVKIHFLVYNISG